MRRIVVFVTALLQIGRLLVVLLQVSALERVMY